MRKLFFCAFVFFSIIAKSQSPWAIPGYVSSDGLITGAHYRYTDTISIEGLLGINFDGSNRFVALKSNYKVRDFGQSNAYASLVLGVKNANVTGLNIVMPLMGVSVGYQYFLENTHTHALCVEGGYWFGWRNYQQTKNGAFGRVAFESTYYNQPWNISLGYKFFIK